MTDGDGILDLYGDMYEIRYYNDRMRAAYDEGRDVPAGIHGSKGQEAPAVGVCDHLGTDDWAFATHRSSHVAIAKGTELKALVAEQLGREGGVCGGRAGEQHVLDDDANFVSGAIVAQHLPSATGVALSHKRRGTDDVSVGFIGEGAANQGAFYECLNFASVNDLPVVFVIEDNDYGISTPKRQVTAVDDNSTRAVGQGMPGERIEGNDVLEIHDAAGAAIERARAGEGPTLLEIETCRLQGHFFDDPVDYRDDGEMAALEELDCMPKIEAALDDADVPAEAVAEVERRAERRVDEAIEYALNQPYPDRAGATTAVFSTPGDSNRSENGNGNGNVAGSPVSESPRPKMAPAVVAGIRSEMARDDDVFVMGEDIAEFGGVFESTEGLYDEFGPDRVVNTPISETAFIGAGVGAAMAGLRPVVELMYVDFAGVAMDQIYNEMAKVTYMSEGAFEVPMVLTTAVGMTPFQDPTHAQTLYGTFSHFPGLKVVVPSSPYDAKGLMRSAIRDDDPVVYMFHKQLMLGMADVADGLGTPAPADDYAVPIGTADVKREGSDVTIATLGLHVHDALNAAEELEEEGVDAEVLDLRSLVPLDREAVLDSVRKTGRLLVVDEDYRSFGLSGELIAMATERDADLLKGASRLAIPDVPVPYSPELKEAIDPGVSEIVTEARALTGE